MPGVTSTFHPGILGVTVESGHTRVKVADDPDYRLESPALGIPRRDNQALVECVMVCGCRWANVAENEHFQAQAAARR